MKKNRKLIAVLVLAFGVLRLNVLITSNLVRTIHTYPSVIDSVPYVNDSEIPLDSDIEVTFSMKMNKKSVEKAFSLNPNVPGSLSWEGNTLIFKPENDFERGKTFLVTINKSAKTSLLIPLKNDHKISFKTLSNPEIALAAPQGFVSEEVKNIVVMFSKSVKKPGEGDILLTEPEIEGERKWVGSTAYVIKPQNLKIGQTYKVTLVQDLESVDGGKLDKGYSFEFVNYGPAVLSISSAGTSGYYSSQNDRDPRGPVTLYFNQAVDTQDIFDKFSLKKSDSGKDSVPVRMQVFARTAADDKENSYYYRDDWQKSWKQKIEFYPLSTLEPNTQYTAELQKGFKNAAGGAPAESGIATSFTTADKPGFIRSSILNGEKDVSQDTRLSFTFRSPMDSAELSRNIVITPSLGEKDGYYVSGYGGSKEMRVNRFLPRSTTFNVFIPSYTKDLYGRPLGEDVNLTFSTSPYKPSLSIYPYGTYFAGFSSSLEKRIITRVTNIDFIMYRLYSLSSEDYVNLYDIKRSDWEKINADTVSDLGYRYIGAWKNDIDVENNLQTDVLYNFERDAGISFKSGHYLLIVTGKSSIDGTFINDNIAFTVGDVAVTSKESYDKLLVWAADISDTEVKSGYDVNIYKPRSNGGYSGGRAFVPGTGFKKDRLELVTSGNTDNDGVFIYEHNGSLPESYYIEVRGENDIGGIFSGWNDGIGLYQFDGVNYSYNTEKPEKYKAFAFTDRTMYRPGQEVMYTAFYRQNDLHTFSSPPKEDNIRLNVKVTELYGSTTIYSKQYEWSDTQSYSDKFILPSDIGLGRYSLSVYINGGHKYSTDFEVQEYVRPEFEVSASVPQDDVIRGSSIKVGLGANYFYGAPVTNSKADYRLYNRSYIFNPRDFQRYKFYSTKLYFGDDFMYRGFEENEVFSGSALTNSEGSYAMDLTASSKSGVSEIYTFEGDVLGESGRKFTGSDEYIVHMAEFYIGLKADSYIGEAGDTSSFDILTLKPNLEPKGNREVSVNVYKRNYFRVKKQDDTGRYYYETSYENILKEQDSFKTDDRGRAEYEFEPDEGGSYILEFVSYDSFGNKSVSDINHYVAADDTGYWRRENHDRIEIVTDKDEYNVGDKADLMAITTMEESIGLITIEAESIIDYKVVKMSGSADSFDINISDKYVPGVYVSGMFVGKGLDVYRPPEFKMGIKKIAVSADDYLLNLDITSDKNVYRPKDKGKINVFASDAQGRPVSGAKVALAIVDDALMTISPIKREDVFSHFYSNRKLSVQTAQSLTSSLDRINANTDIGAKGGSGSKGGAGGEYVDLTRKDFSETALWIVDVVTDGSGKAVADFELPDSVTRWNVFALAQSSDGAKFGQNTANFGSAMDVFSISALPRFLREGDSFQLGTVVHNNTDRFINASVSANVENIELLGESTLSIGIPANSSKRVYFDAVAGKEGASKIGFSTYNGSALVDVVEQGVSILPFGVEKVSSVSNTLRYEAQEEFLIEPGVNQKNGGLETKAFTSVVGLMDGSLQFLRNYEYYCTEQVTSTLLPHIFKYRYNQMNGLTEDSEDIKMVLDAGLSRILQLQRNDGGWGFWKESTESSIHNTSRALETLHMLKSTGYSVDTSVLSSGINYLQNSLNSSQNLLNTNPDEYSYPLYVLELLGSKQNGRLQILYDRKAALSDYGKAHLIMAMSHNGGDWEYHIKNLKSELVQKSDLGSGRLFWEGPRNAYWFLGGDRTATATILRAFNHVDPNSPVADLAVKYLTQRGRDNNHMITSSEGISYVAVLENYLERNIKLRDSDISLLINDVEVGSGTLESSSKTSRFENLTPISVFNEGNNNVTLKSSKGGLSYYSMILRTLVPFEEVEEMSNDIAIDREFFDSAGNKIENGKFKVGESYTVKLTLAAPKIRRNLVIEDYLAAGFESVNGTLLNEGGLSSSENDSYSYGYSYYEYDDGPGTLYVTNSEMRDSKTILFSDYMRSGLYEYTYVIRAIVPGEFKLRPAQVYEMYSPDIRGNTDGGIVSVSY